MKNFKSPYSKMYLVSPGVYDKLLTCLDEKDKKTTELLNIEKEIGERPSESVIQDITTEDFEPESLAEQESELQPQVMETIPPTPEVFGEGEQFQQPEEEMIEEGEVVEPSGEMVEQMMPPGQPDIQQQQPVNPLRNPCSVVTTDPSRVVKPTLIYNPNPKPKSKVLHTTAKNIVKKYRSLKPNVQPKLIAKRQLIAPQLMREQTPIKPTLIMPNIMPVQVQARETTSIPVTTKVKKHQCPICMKFFDRPWSLTRHVGSVHKNLGSVKELLGKDKPQKVLVTQQPLLTQQQTITPSRPTVINQPKVGMKFIQDVDVPMMTDTFESWVRPGKRKASEAKLRMKPAIRRKTGQTTQEQAVAPETFESWN